MQVSVEKIICNECGYESYDYNEFEFCVYCDTAMCDKCVKYKFVDGLDEPVCKKCNH